jgi:hypothetical protein
MALGQIEQTMFHRERRIGLQTALISPGTGLQPQPKAYSLADSQNPSNPQKCFRIRGTSGEIEYCCDLKGRAPCLVLFRTAVVQFLGR